MASGGADLQGGAAQGDALAQPHKRGLQQSVAICFGGEGRWRRLLRAGCRCCCCCCRGRWHCCCCCCCVRCAEQQWGGHPFLLLGLARRLLPAAERKPCRQRQRCRGPLGRLLRLQLLRLRRRQQRGRGRNAFSRWMLLLLLIICSLLPARLCTARQQLGPPCCGPPSWTAGS